MLYQGELYEQLSRKILQELTDPYLTESELFILIDKLIEKDIILAKKLAIISWREIKKYQRDL